MKATVKPRAQKIVIKSMTETIDKFDKMNIDKNDVEKNNVEKNEDEKINNDNIDICCPEGVIAGSDYTKEERQKQYGKVAGGGGSTKPEQYQREQIEKGTGRLCEKTQMRINWRKNEMIEKKNPMINIDGFDYTENFDGKQIFGSNIVWINLKSVVGKGGSQTRTLRDECYTFVNAQLRLLQTTESPCYFANIFDGDEAHARKKMFIYLLTLPEFSTVKKYVYVGDLKNYFDWVKAIC